MALAHETNLPARGLRGDLIESDHPDYETARRIFNAMIDRRPKAIVRPIDDRDVITAVRFAGEQGMLLSVRGGGHGVAGFAMNDGGLVLDLSRMKGISFDPEKRTVRAQGGCTWSDVDSATHPFGMHAAGGVVSTTGIAGLALGGGLGHLTRRAGLTCDNLLSAGVVTADGQLVMASEKENADLFWALRGGGGNFGVVTSFEFRLHPIRTVYAGPVLWPPDQAVEAMRFYREFMKEAPQELNALFAFIVVPPEPPFPQHLHNRPMSGVVICYSGDPQKGPEVTKSLRTFGSPALDATGQLPFPMLQKAFDAVSPPGLQNYWKTDFFSELNDDAIEAHTAFGKDVPNIFSGSIIFPIDGAAHNARNEDTAWGFRDANFSNVIYAAYEDPAKTPEMIQWVRDYWAAVHPHSTGGTYVNFAMDEGEEHVNACYGRNLTRLAKIKGLYDPGNLFRMNQNIKPGRP